MTLQSNSKPKTMNMITIGNADWKEKFVEMLWLYGEPSLTHLDECVTFKDKHLPSKIYKFINLDNMSRVIKSIEDNKIYLNSPSNFNDPYDSMCKLSIARLLIVIRRQAKLHKAIKERLNFNYCKNTSQDISLKLKTFKKEQRENLDNEKDRILNRFKDILLISCFTEDYQSVLMWAHYAKNHTGICIEYDISGLNELHILRRGLHPVIYNNKMIDITSLIFRQLNNQPINLLLILKSTIYKSINWSYEKEWRLLIKKSSNNYIIAPKPTKIFLGSKIDGNNELILRKHCDRLLIDVSKMRHSEHEHKMIHY
ncbi:hypothetical protein CDPAHKCJ_01713 [Cobetia sp. MB87]|nr:hypothetical protein [Cobetia sp. MB87]